MLELRSLSKEFGRTIAVNDLSITCEKREFLVIFGPAGAGKTTTLRLIAGVTEPTGGEVYFGGQSLKGVPPEHRNMSMAFENYNLYSHLSVFKNLAFPLKARGSPPSESAFESYGPRSNEPPRHLLGAPRDGAGGLRPTRLGSRSCLGG